MTQFWFSCICYIQGPVCCCNYCTYCVAFLCVHHINSLRKEAILKSFHRAGYETDFWYIRDCNPLIKTFIKRPDVFGRVFFRFLLTHLSSV